MLFTASTLMTSWINFRVDKMVEKSKNLFVILEI